MRSLVITGLVVATAFALLTVTGPTGAANEETKRALDALGQAYVLAFESGDAEALANCFAKSGEYVAVDGTTYAGRAAIREAANAFFTACPGATLATKAEGLRQIGSGVAIKNGVATIFEETGRVRSRVRYTILYTMEDGRFVIASLAEHELRKGDLSPKEHLEELSWLVGDWMDDSDEARIRTRCDWSDDGPFLIQKIDVRDRSGLSTHYSQRIGWDESLGKIRSWAFSSDGGHGSGVWTRTEDGWVIQSRGVSAEGAVGTGAYRIRCVSEDVYRWEATRSVVGDEVVSSESHMIVRCPPEPE